MKALTEENKAKLVEAEAEVPKAVAESIDHGHLSIWDYYRLRNIQADTDMRSSFAVQTTPSKSEDGKAIRSNN